MPLLGFRVGLYCASLRAGNAGDQFVERRISHADHDDIPRASVDVHGVHIDVRGGTRERVQGMLGVIA